MGGFAMKNIHFSVDDIIGVFEWLNMRKKMSLSIFDAPEFRVAKELHVFKNPHPPGKDTFCR